MLGNDAYHDFLKTKYALAEDTGFSVDPAELHPALKPHQRDAVVWALAGGRRAVFASFGLGKTLMQLEFSRLVGKYIGGQALLVLPLGVRQEFVRDAVELLGMAPPVYITSMAQARACAAPILMTNYERVRDGDIDPQCFQAACLDEAAVLRSYGSKTYQTFLEKFRGVPYKMVSTATPAPNRYKEIIHYAGYLEVMDTGQALTRFFKRDSSKAGNLTLYPGKEKEFWLWVSSWALFITKPSDLGYSDEGYDLPPLKVNYRQVRPDTEPVFDRDGQGMLERDVAASLQDEAAEKRESIGIRVAEAKRIVEEAGPDVHFLLWHDLEAERHALKKALPEAVDIYGAMDYDQRERRVVDFSEGKTRLFATKKSLSGSGCNFQRHCHRAVFVGIDYKFEDFIQAIHRIYRFLQEEEVTIDVIYTPAERGILETLLQKWKQHDEMQAQMVAIIKEYGLSGSSIREKLARSMGVKRVEVQGNHFKAVYNDCIEETAAMEENSVDLVHTSIPFGNHYEYSASVNDLGYNLDNEQFFRQMDFLSPHLLRVLRPGRVMAVHVKDRVLFGNATGLGTPTLDAFHAECILHYRKHGFLFLGMVTILTDVVRENNQTYRLGWTEQCKDGSKMGVGCEEYLLLFRKRPTDTSKAYADVPVKKDKDEYTRAQWQIDAAGFWRTSGDRLPTKAELGSLRSKEAELVPPPAVPTKEELEAAPVEQMQKLYRKYSRGSVYNYAEHVELAQALDARGKLPATFAVVAPGSWNAGVWDDINRMRTLNTQQSRRREQMHICPLQLDIIERTIHRYTNPGDVVYDPFGGLMSVPYMAVKMGRYGVGCELNADYFRDGVGYLEAAEAEVDVPTLFDLVGESG